MHSSKCWVMPKRSVVHDDAAMKIRPRQVTDDDRPAGKERRSDSASACPEDNGCDDQLDQRERREDSAREGQRVDRSSFNYQPKKLSASLLADFLPVGHEGAAQQAAVEARRQWTRRRHPDSMSR